MRKLGFKVWSSNKEYISLAQKFYQKGVYDYIELYVDPKPKDDYVSGWKQLEVPFHLHAPHSYSGFNLSQKGQKESNEVLMDQVEYFRKNLNPSYIIFHPGVDGALTETLRQLISFKSEFPEIFKVALIENKPKLGINGEECLGASPEEVKRIIDTVQMGFCMDIGHAICYAAWAQKPWENILNDFNRLKPQVYHLSDGDVGSSQDRHEHFGAGNFDLAKIMNMVPHDAFLAVETKRDSREDLADFEKDVNFLKRYF